MTNLILLFNVTKHQKCVKFISKLMVWVAQKKTVINLHFFNTRLSEDVIPLCK